jgi:TolB-like protein
MHHTLSPRLFLTAAIVLGAPVVAASVAHADKPIVAVLPFQSPNDHNLGMMGRNAQPTFVTELVKSKKVRVVNEKQLDKAVKRFERQMTGLVDPKTAKQIGKFLNADYILHGALSFTGDAFTMTVHLTNVETLEVEFAEDVDFRETSKFRIAVRTAAQAIAATASGEGRAKGKHEAFLNIDPRHFYDTAEACIRALKGLEAWRYEGEVDEELDGKKVHVKLRYGKPKPGTPLQVFEEGMGSNDKPIGVVYVDEPDDRGAGFVAKWIKEKDKSKKKRGDFGLGARVSNAGYKYRIAVGAVEDEAEGNAQLVTMFRDKLLETLDESDTFLGKEESEITELVMDLGRGSAKKKALKKVHSMGVDFILEGKFIGSPGKRRADFKIISAMTGEVWGKLKFETRI